MTVLHYAFRRLSQNSIRLAISRLREIYERTSEPHDHVLSLQKKKKVFSFIQSNIIWDAISMSSQIIMPISNVAKKGNPHQEYI